MSSPDIRPDLKARPIKRAREDNLDQEEVGLVQRARKGLTHPEQRHHRRTNLLCLADEVLFIVFAEMIITKRGNILRDPYGAISLAITQPRLLQIFGGLITHVTTDFRQGRASPFILLPESFFIDILPFLGFSLRQLCLRQLGCGFIKNVAKVCPNIEVFSFSAKHCECSRCLRTFSNVLKLQIRSLCIIRPTPKYLKLIRYTPPELSLVRCVYTCFHELCRILRDPPKQLSIDLDFHYNSYGIKRDHDLIVAILCDACPTLERLQFTTDILTVLDKNSTESFVERATELISLARINTIESKCRSFSVEGDASIKLLKRVHSNAAIEIGCYQNCSIYDSGDGMSFTKLYLGETCPNMDFSRVPHVIITSRCTLLWKDALKGLKLKSGEVEDVNMADFLRLDIERVDMNYSLVRRGKWKWLKKIGELRLTDNEDYMNLPDITEFVRGLTEIVEVFDGDLYWFVDTEFLRLENKPRSTVEEVRLREDLRELDIAVDKFEERTRSGEMIRSVVRRIRGSLLAKKSRHI